MTDYPHSSTWYETHVHRDLIKLVFIFFAHTDCVPPIRKTIVQPSTLKGGFICPFTGVQ